MLSRRVASLRNINSPEKKFKLQIMQLISNKSQKYTRESEKQNHFSFHLIQLMSFLRKKLINS